MDEYNALFRQRSLHPLVTVGDLAKADEALFTDEETDFGMYSVILLDEYFGDILRNGERIECRPNRIVQLHPGVRLSTYLNNIRAPKGLVLSFRPELLDKSGLGRDFYMFSKFLETDHGGTLQLDARQKAIIMSCFTNIQSELETERDYLSNHMIRLGIGQILSHCKRIYERQYCSAGSRSHTFRERMDTIIDNYLNSGLPEQQGQPTVAWCAQQFNLSPNYFGDLVKRELRISAQDYIQQKIIITAQRLLHDTTMTVSEISEQLGFSYPNHFTRMFKRNTGMTPLEYRQK